ncbi:MAG: hypothetical protein HKP59_02600 [Lutibacter sp.]|uniref:hypothetical protein n=1 Tax=Lutibacter sp. TaxID=1925666 RepID=UPI0017F1AB66|nr:hypothetical protein [Lutibacter sp.]MBT8316495.1 hypothetical protein [Lutibacter sp.]NNJ57355.1 hypothetical protein [Lutibacter sp.]
MRKSNYISFFIVITLLISAFSIKTESSTSDKFKLETVEKSFLAGTKVTLTFFTENGKKPLLFIHNSYGSTVISPKKVEAKLDFIIPPVFSKKTGILNWTLIYEGKSQLKSSIEILPNNTTKTLIESYLGPRSIQAGKRDYSMFVIIPTDEFDNPLLENTSLKINQQFLDNITSTEEKTKNLIAWNTIMAKEKAGSILVSSSCNSTNSNELTTIIYPSNPTNFIISFNRNHDFADGNQITELTTSKIVDEFGNTISDGTMVVFNIVNTENTILKTRATTINGFAKAKILHPDSKDIWSVKGFVNGLAESNTITINYEPITTNFNVHFSENNRKITVGPIESFMNQLIPDGALVKLKIFNNNNLVETKTGTSYKGFITFEIAAEFYRENSYSFIVEVLGNSKEIETKNYATKTE